MILKVKLLLRKERVGGINHDVVSYIELEPEVQVGTLGSVSGFPRGWTCTTTQLSGSLYNILSAQVTTNMITSITEDTQS
jgi:hypothetical protein